MLKFSRRALLGGITSVLVGAAAISPVQAQDKLTVVATTGMIADAARVIGGDAVEVTALMSAGVDPHSYRQTRSDIVAMTRSDIVLWHGLYLEAQMESFFEELSSRVPVIPVAEALPRDQLLAHEDYDARFDPHVWMDPALWADVVDSVARAMGGLRPDLIDVFETNATRFRQELVALDGYTRTALEGVPESQRVLLTAHDAFGYFGQAYGFEVVGIQGISTDSEAGLNRISELVDMLVARDIRAVFAETSVSDRNVRALIEGAAAQGHDVVIGGSLFSDAMGPSGTYEGTYLGMIDHNVTTIARALGADVPTAGRMGALASGS